jgi:hypothetical protein
MMRGSVLVGFTVMCACAAAHEATARADQLRHPAGFTFALPDLGKAWAHETHGDVLVVADDSDRLPELQLFAFPVKQEGTLAEIAGRIAAEVVHQGVEPIASPLKVAKLVGTPAQEAIGDARAVTGELLLNGEDRAAFAVVQRKSRSLILLAIPKDGIYERGVSNFRAVLHGLAPGASVAAAPSAPAAPGKPAPPVATGTAMPKLPDIIAIRELTATSTFADKRDLYAAWRTIYYDAVLDKATQEYMPTTAWCEGKPDEGLGEGVTIAFAVPTQLDAIHVAAGVWKSAKLFASNNRITALDVALDGKTTTVKPATTRTWLSVPIGRPVSTISLKIAAVARGAMNDSCISGISLVRKDAEFTAIVGIDAAAAAALPRALSTIQSALENPDPAGLEKLLDFPFTLHPAAGFAMGAPKPIKHASWHSLEAACRAQAKAEAAGTLDESKPITCPGPTNVDPGDDRSAGLISTAPAMVEVKFPSHREVQEFWRLRWHDGAWHLSAIDYD